MKGHVIVEKGSKAGWVFVPEAHLRFNLIMLDEEAVLHSLETYPVGSRGVFSSARRRFFSASS